MTDNFVHLPHNSDAALAAGGLWILSVRTFEKNVTIYLSNFYIVNKMNYITCIIKKNNPAPSKRRVIIKNKNIKYEITEAAP
jgi:hypothetical protein